VFWASPNRSKKAKSWGVTFGLATVPLSPVKLMLGTVGGGWNENSMSLAALDVMLLVLLVLLRNRIRSRLSN
jgi:hypothetical protein